MAWQEMRCSRHEKALYHWLGVRAKQKGTWLTVILPLNAVVALSGSLVRGLASH